MRGGRAVGGLWRGQRTAHAADGEGHLQRSARSAQQRTAHGVQGTTLNHSLSYVTVLWIPEERRSLVQHATCAALCNMRRAL